jgi:LPXTG-motif cell wall-anchored protein
MGDGSGGTGAPGRLAWIAVKPPLALLAAVYAAICLLVLPASLQAATEAPAKPGRGDPATSTGPTTPPDAPPASPAEPGTGKSPALAAQPSADQAPAPAADPSKRAPSRRASRHVARAAGSGSVTIHDFAFSPGSLTVHVGDRVSWFNQGPSGHSATANDGSFDTGVLAKGTSGSFTFSKPGTFAYHCTPHPFMHGSITVLAASTGSGSGSTSGGSAGHASAGKSATGSPSSSSGSGTGEAQAGLPRTGFDVAFVAGLGLALLALGSLLRRRAAARS